MHTAVMILVLPPLGVIETGVSKVGKSSKIEELISGRVVIQNYSRLIYDL